MSKGGSPPPAADYVGASREQGRQNIEAARVGAALNRVNQVTPYGSTTYRRVGGGQMTTPTTPSGPSTQAFRPGGGTGISDVTVGAFGLPSNWRTGGAATPSALADALRNGSISTSVASPTTDVSQDQWEQITTLSPAQQALLEQQQGNQQSLGNLASSRMAQVRGQAPLDTYNPGDFAAQRDLVTDTLYGASTKYLDPQFARQEEAARTRLINSGNTQGSEGWSNEMSDFNQSRQAAYADARDRAILAGGQEQSRLMADALRGRQQQISERQIPLEESLALMSALGGGGGNGMNPGAVPQVGGPQAAPYFDAVGQQQAQNMNYYNSEQQRQAQNTQAAVGVLSAVAMAY